MCTITALALAAILSADLPNNDIDDRFGDFVGVEVNACAVDPRTDAIFVGGNFTAWQRADSSVVTRGNLVAFAPDGSVLDWAPETTGQVLGMELVGDTLYLFGYFTAVNGVARNRVAAVSATTGALLPFDAGVVGTSTWDGVVSDGVLYLCGLFTDVGGSARANLAAVDAVSGALRAWNPGTNGEVYAVAVSGSSIYAVGNFSSFAGQGRGYGGAMTSAGSVLPWDPRADLHIRDIAVIPAGIVVGGQFTTIAGSPRPHLALVDSVDGDDLGWDLDPDGNIGDFAATSAGLYVAGGFDTIGGVTRHGAALIADDGSVTAWTPTPDDGYYCIAGGARGVYGGAGAMYPYTRPQTPRVTRIEASWQGATFDIADLALTGRYFHANSPDVPTVELTGPAAFTVTVTGVTVSDEGHLSGVGDFSGAPMGTYTLTLTNPDGRSTTVIKAVTLSMIDETVAITGSGGAGGGGGNGCGNGGGIFGLVSLGLLMGWSLKKRQLIER